MEKQIEQYLKRKVKEIGGLCIKQTGYKGIPDRLILYQGTAAFVEVKDTGKKPRPEQVVWQLRLIGHGFTAAVIDSKEAVDNFVNALEAGGVYGTVTRIPTAGSRVYKE